MVRLATRFWSDSGGESCQNRVQNRGRIATESRTLTPTILNLSGDEHANRRRVWNRGFSTESLREYEDIIARRVEQLIEKIGAIDGPVDLSSWLSFFQFDFMGDMA